MQVWSCKYVNNLTDTYLHGTVHLFMLRPMCQSIDTFMSEFTNVVLDTCEAVAAAPVTVPMSVPPGAAVVEFKACDMECT